VLQVILSEGINVLGLHIEDQVFPKRCGHLDGKGLIPAEDFAKKVEIAVKAAKDCSDG
jgi:methylisocitrate lyase